MSHEYEQEELRKRALKRIQECKDNIPGYREQILESLIEREMFSKALEHNSNLDYQERLRKAQSAAVEREQHSNSIKCFCSKIRELLK